MAEFEVFDVARALRPLYGRRLHPGDPARPTADRAPYRAKAEGRNRIVSA